MAKKVNQQRIVDIVKYIVDNKASMVTTGKVFNVSRATVFNYCNKRIEDIDYELYLKVRETLKENAEDKINRAVQSKHQKVRSEIENLLDTKFKELGITYEK